MHRRWRFCVKQNANLIHLEDRHDIIDHFLPLHLVGHSLQELYFIFNEVEHNVVLQIPEIFHIAEHLQQRLQGLGVCFQSNNIEFLESTSSWEVACMEQFRVVPVV